MRSWPSPAVPLLPGEGLPLRLYDSATHKVRPTAPGETATMYVCGITPYDATHLGHAATYIAFDLVNRAWRDSGHQVRYVQNVTDVDDPLLVRARETGVDWQELATSEIGGYRDDMTDLRVLRPDDYVSVIDSIPLLASRVGDLIREEAAYRVDADWYFSIGSDPKFGNVAGLDRTAEIALFGERGGDPDRAGKRDRLDPLLWRAATDGEPSWESEVGPGRPGWHLECAAIASDALGMGFDVQGGGSDLIFPHHEMCASQARVFTGESLFARHYVHAGMVAYQGAKMSKSLGNLVFVSQLIDEGVEPMAIRLAVLAHHYRSDWEWTDADLTGGIERARRWRAAIGPPTGPPAHRLLATLRERIADDLDAPGAIAAVDDWAEAQRQRGGDDPTAPGLAARGIDALLGVAL